MDMLLWLTLQDPTVAQHMLCCGLHVAAYVLQLLRTCVAAAQHMQCHGLHEAAFTL